MPCPETQLNKEGTVTQEISTVHAKEHRIKSQVLILLCNFVNHGLSGSKFYWTRLSLRSDAALNCTVLSWWQTGDLNSRL